MSVAASRGANRQALRSVTDSVHQALHHAPALKCLTSDRISAVEYRRALGLFLSFYQMVECYRGTRWTSFSLAEEIDALRADLPDPPAATPGSIALTSGLALGALYVAFGASFGRSTFRDPVLRALPKESHNFIALRPKPDLWRRLVDTIETTQTPHDVQDGAIYVFNYMHRLSHSGGPLHE